MAEKIRIYRRDEGVCQLCLKEESAARECVVSWSQYEQITLLPGSKAAKQLKRMHRFFAHITTRRKAVGEFISNSWIVRMMRLPKFEYRVPRTIAEAVKIVGGRWANGGSSLPAVRICTQT